MKRMTYTVTWAAGNETHTRLFPDQADGRCCVFCCLSDGPMVPVGRAAGEGQVFAHEACAPGLRTEAS